MTVAPSAHYRRVRRAFENLDGATVERAAALVAREQAAARQVRPELPADFESAGVCAAALERLSGSGHHGLVATEDGRAVAVMTAAVGDRAAAGRTPACRPRIRRRPGPRRSDRVLAAGFGDLASPLIAGGVRRYYLLHAALPRLPEALSNLGFGRNGAYGIQPAAPQRQLMLKVGSHSSGESLTKLAPPKTPALAKTRST